MKNFTSYFLSVFALTQIVTNVCAESARAEIVVLSDKERECILKLSREILDKTRGTEREAWQSIQFESDVFFRKNHLETDEYTVYGKSEKLTPRDYKVQFKAKFGEVKGGQGCELKGDATLVDAEGVTVATYDHFKGSFSGLSTKEYLYNERLDKRIVMSKAFVTEKAFSPATEVKVKDKPVSFKEIVSHDAVPFAMEQAAWHGLLKRLSPKTRTFKTFRFGSRIFVWGDMVAHGKQAWEVVFGEDGKEPSFIPVADVVWEKINSKLSEKYKIEQTGVLRVETEYKQELERHNPAPPNAEVEVKPEGKTPSTHNAPSSTPEDEAYKREMLRRLRDKN